MSCWLNYNKVCRVATSVSDLLPCNFCLKFLSFVSVNFFFFLTEALTSDCIFVGRADNKLPLLVKNEPPVVSLISVSQIYSNSCSIISVGDLPTPAYNYYSFEKVNCFTKGELLTFDARYKLKYYVNGLRAKAYGCRAAGLVIESLRMFHRSAD